MNVRNGFIIILGVFLILTACVGSASSAEGAETVFLYQNGAVEPNTNYYQPNWGISNDFDSDENGLVSSTSGNLGNSGTRYIYYPNGDKTKTGYYLLRPTGYVTISGASYTGSSGGYVALGDTITFNLDVPAESMKPENYGLIFTSPSGSKTTVFSGVDFTIWETAPHSVYLNSVEEGRWTVQAYFKTGTEEGMLNPLASPTYIYGYNTYSFTVSNYDNSQIFDFNRNSGTTSKIISPGDSVTIYLQGPLGVNPTISADKDGLILPNPTETDGIFGTPGQSSYHTYTIQTVSGQTQPHKYILTLTPEYGSSKTLTLTVADTVVSSIPLTIAEPKIGATPVTSTSTTDINISPQSVSWSPDVTTFEQNTQYTATIVVTVQDGVLLDDILTATINGTPASVSRDSDTQATITYTVKTPVEVTDLSVTIPTPSITATPAKSVSVTSTPGGLVYDGAVTWSPYAYSSFEGDTEYTATITITTTDGAVFSKSPTATVNGDAVTVTRISDTTVTASKTFSKTPSTISTVAVTISEPLTGETPATTATLDDTVKDRATIKEITWSPVDTTFKEDVVYTVTMKIETTDGSLFTTYPHVTVNGVGATVTRESDTSITIEQSFTKTNTIISKADITISEPVIGNYPVTYATVTSTPDGKVGTSTVTWSPSTYKFGADTEYTATVTLYATTGSIFDSSPDITVNGEEATITRTSDTIITVSKPFKKTPAIISTAIAVTIPEPITGETPAITVTLDDMVKDKVTVKEVTWTPDDTTFKGETFYKATIQIETVDGNIFSTSPSVTINGGKTSVTRNSDTLITLEKSFAKTKAVVSEISVTLSEPKIWSTPSYATVTSTPDGKVVTTSVAWTPTTNKFEADTEYTATVTVTTVSGAVFDSSPDITLNGEMISNNDIIRDSDTSITITKTYSKTPSAVPNVIPLTLEVPEIGKEPATSAEFDQIVVGAVVVEKITWTPNDDTFKENTVYTAEVKLKPADGYAFAELSSIIVNGEKVAITESTESSITITKTFPKTDVIVSNIDVLLVNPITGDTPQYTADAVVPTGETSTASIIWTPAVTYFESNKVYTATISIPTPNNYIFTEVTKVNNGAAKILSVSNTLITAELTFPETKSDKINVLNGWNFISVPRILHESKDTAEELFGTIDTADHPILKYNAEEQKWESVAEDEKIVPLQGYWIYAKTQTSFELPRTMEPGITPPTVNVYEGWNAVGLSAKEPLRAENAFTGLNWRLVIPWNLETQEFDSALVRYGSAESSSYNYINTKVGCWLYLDSDGIICGQTV